MRVDPHLDRGSFVLGPVQRYRIRDSLCPKEITVEMDTSKSEEKAGLLPPVTGDGLIPRDQRLPRGHRGVCSAAGS